MTSFTKYAAPLALAALATGAAAMDDLDANGDGMITMEEAQAANPEMTPDQFSEMDANGDGAIDEAELSDARDAGLMPASDSES